MLLQGSALTLSLSIFPVIRLAIHRALVMGNLCETCQLLKENGRTERDYDPDRDEDTPVACDGCELFLQVRMANKLRYSYDSTETIHKDKNGLSFARIGGSEGTVDLFAVPGE
jgi:hypothetical protein